MAEAAVWKADIAAPEARAGAIPWYLWAGLVAATSAVVGGQWDISWHRSIGRDTFWTPAHIAIYLCGIIAGFSGAYIVLTTTFGSGPRVASAVRIWSFRGPLGAFMCIWGAVGMLTSAPFDEWWHSAYGLDVKILSPPHTVLAMGLIAIQVGALIQVLGEMNRTPAAAGGRRRALEWMFLYGGAMIFSTLQTVIMEHTFRSNMHSSDFYQWAGAVSLLGLVGMSRACDYRWSASIVAGMYMLFIIGLIIVLPFFPAEPKLGPVYQQVKFFVPPGFPILVIFPALALDFLLKRFEKLRPWALSVLSGAAFFLIFVCVQWPFGDFLMAPASFNWFFGSHYLDYNDSPQGYAARHIFFPQEPQGAFLKGMGIALLVSVLAARFSLGWGDWMRKIQR